MDKQHLDYVNSNLSITKNIVIGNDVINIPICSTELLELFSSWKPGKAMYLD